jgi:hypothetical protein
MAPTDTFYIDFAVFLLACQVSCIALFGTYSIDTSIHSGWLRFFFNGNNLNYLTTFTENGRKFHYPLPKETNPTTIIIITRHASALVEVTLSPVTMNHNHEGTKKTDIIVAYCLVV